jgi:hypothetical protein
MPVGRGPVLGCGVLTPGRVADRAQVVHRDQAVGDQVLDQRHERVDLLRGVDDDHRHRQVARQPRSGVPDHADAPTIGHIASRDAAQR